MLEPNLYIQKHKRFNFVMGLLDGGFFGFALGFTSFMTIIPLFVSSMTSSAILIGLIPAIHTFGWQFPPLFTARFVARQTKYKNFLMKATIHERLPFLVLAGVAWFSPGLGPTISLILIFICLSWQGIGGGFASNPWQSMVAKIMPPELRGTYYGAQSAAMSLLLSISAVLSGLILQAYPSPLDFTLCFIFNFLAMLVSLAFLGLVREPETQPARLHETQAPLWKNTLTILRRDASFRWFLIVRMLAQLSTMGFSFYAVYAVQYYHISEGMIGLLTGLLTGVQIVANPIMGYLGDRFGCRLAMELGLIAAALSALLAWLAPGVGWLYPVFILAGIASVALWTVSMAMTLEFGSETERPLYIGMANTLIAPVTILTPILGGWLVETARRVELPFGMPQGLFPGGYPATFVVSAICALITVAVIHFKLHPPRVDPGPTPVASPSESL